MNVDTRLSLKYKLSQQYSKLKSLIRFYQEDIDIAVAKKQIIDLQNLNAPYFMVGIPGSVHILKLSAKYLPDSENLILIANGMDEWEIGKAKRLVKPRHVISLDEKQVVPHGKVLDMLFDNFPRPFGILDYDCFVFNPACFKQMNSLEDGQMMSTIFYQGSPMLGRTPQTFFLFFNATIIQSLRKKYKVNCGITDFSKRLPGGAVRKLKEIGIDEHHYPEYNKPYFDTLRLIYSLGVAEGYKVNFLDHYHADSMNNADVFHVGGVADPNTTYGWWGVRGSYFWWRALETCEDKELKSRYNERFGNRTSQDVFRNFPEYRERTGQALLDFYETLLV